MVIEVIVAAITIGALFIGVKYLWSIRPRNYRISGFKWDKDVSFCVRTDWGVSIQETFRIMGDNVAEIGIRVTIRKIKKPIVLIFDYGYGIKEHSRGVEVVNNDLGSFRYFLYLKGSDLFLEEVTI